MSEIDQGGFVYPQVTYAFGEEVHHKGITVRDHFAGIAMRAICAQHDVKDRAAMDMIAAMSYEMADAMIEAGKQ